MKSVRIRIYSGPHFPAFGLNTEKYSIISPYSVRMGENADQINSEYRHFSCSVNPQETVKNFIFCAVTFLRFFLANMIHMIDYS